MEEPSMESKHEIREQEFAQKQCQLCQPRIERIASLEAALKEKEHHKWPTVRNKREAELQIENVALQSQLAESRSQIEALKDEQEDYKGRLWCALGQPMNVEFIAATKALKAQKDALEAQLADYGKPVTNEEWNFDDELLPTPALKEMFKRMRATFDDLLRRRTQSRQPMSERSAEE